MDRVAEDGVAAHGATRMQATASTQGAPAPAGASPCVSLRHLVQLLEGGDPEELLEHAKLEMFLDQVFGFTPKGRLIAFRAARCRSTSPTPCTPTSVTPRRRLRQRPAVPLDTRLRNGDEVEIQTLKAHSPPASWEGFAVTGRARSAIRRAAREAVRRQFTELGRRLITATFERLELFYSDDKLKRALPRLAQKSIDDVLAAVARNEMPVADVVRAIAPDARLADPTSAYRPKNRTTTATARRAGST